MGEIRPTELSITANKGINLFEIITDQFYDKFYVDGVALKPLQPETALVGDPVVLMCSVSHGKDVSFSWTKDGVLIRPDQRVDIESGRKSSTLSIERAESKDSGGYTCIASNTAAAARTTAMLTVNGRVYRSVVVICSQ